VLAALLIVEPFVFCAMSAESVPSSLDCTGCRIAVTDRKLAALTEHDLLPLEEPMVATNEIECRSEGGK
jgi:hypothetical protein